MDINDARAGLADIQARQAQAVQEAARWRWPRWYVSATTALMVAVSVALDFYHDAALLIVVYCCGVSLLQVPVFLLALLLVRGLVITVAAVYVLSRLALGAVGAPLPSTIAGVLMAGAYVAGLPAAQEMTARRLRAGR